MILIVSNSVFNEKVIVAAFYLEKALVGASSVIVKTNCKTDGSVYSTTQDSCPRTAEPH